MRQKIALKLVINPLFYHFLRSSLSASQSGAKQKYKIVQEKPSRKHFLIFARGIKISRELNTLLSVFPLHPRS